MTAAAGLLLYAITLTWLVPPALHRLTHGGIAPRFGIAAWLTAVSATVVAWIAAIGLLVIALVRSGTDSSAVTFCLRALGMPGHAGTPGRLATVVLIAMALSLTALIGRRVARGMHQLRSKSNEHADSARILGVRSSRPGVVVVDAAQPTAYCVAGRPHAIVVTTAALDILAPHELDAVLAHEQAHIDGHHHRILVTLRALAASMPKLPLFAKSSSAVARLLEMCADDVAVRRCGIDALLSGLANLAGHPAMAVERLGAADTAVVVRATRLTAPPQLLLQWRASLLATVVIALILFAPAVLQILCNG
jgi:Zn-dependent protease with chaperone function